MHSEVEKAGIHAEVITADSLDALEAYLEEKQAGIAQEHLKSFEPYLCDDYVLIVSWIASRQQVREEFPEYAAGDGSLANGRWPCVYVEFPTDRAFYPLRATSGYGDDMISFNLVVAGFVKPETDAAWAEELNVRYFEQSTLSPLTPKDFVKGITPGTVVYTRIEHWVKASNLTHDLWLVPTRPPRMAYARMLNALSGLVSIVPCFIVYIAAISYLSAGLAGAVLFRRWRGFACLGLWNLLTVLALSLAIRHVAGEQGEMLRNCVWTDGGTRWHKFVVLFSLFFMLMTLAIGRLLYLPLG